MPARLFVILTVLLLVGCDTNERISKLEKQNQELIAEIKRGQAAAHFDMQAKCARDSKVWFNENWGRGDKGTLSLSYINHYNKNLNKCFIEVEYHYKLGGESWTNHESLWDIYENTQYGEFSVTHMVYLVKSEGYHDEPSVGLCEVYGKKCKTVDEFNDLVRPYISN